MTDPMEMARGLVEQLAELQPIRYLLRWKGSKIPRGAKVGDVPIAWTQHGIVRGADGQTLGYYERTIEWGGPDRDEHEMVIRAKAQVFDTEGRPCLESGTRTGEGVPHDTVSLGRFHGIEEEP